MIVAMFVIPLGITMWALCRAHRVLTPKDVLDREDLEQEQYVSMLR